MSMPCPRCKKQHEVGEYGPRPELAAEPLGHVMTAQTRKYGVDVRSGTPFAPPDVKCECGTTLRQFVPIFKVLEYGWEWRIT